MGAAWYGGADKSGVIASGRAVDLPADRIITVERYGCLIRRGDG